MAISELITFDGGNDYYVYQHIFANNSLYIGKGKNNRAYRLDKTREGSGKWLNTFKKYGKPHIKIIRKKMLECDALELEMFIISELKDSGYNLCNLTDGGEGVSGYKHTEQTKAKLRNIALKLSNEQKEHSKKTQFKNGTKVSASVIKKRTKTRLLRKSNMKKIMCENTGYVFDSIGKAAFWANIKHHGISNHLSGKTKSSGRHPDTKEKLTWRYV